MLFAISEYVASQRYDAFTSLVRHPDLFDWICRQVESESWLHQLDVFQNVQLPGSFPLNQKLPFGDPSVIAAAIDPKDPTSAKRAERNSQSADQLNQIFNVVTQLLQPVLGASQPIADWSPAWSQVLIDVYRDRPLDLDNPATDTSQIDDTTLAACETILTALASPCLLYTSPSPRDATLSRMPSSA